MCYGVIPRHVQTQTVIFFSVAEEDAHYGPHQVGCAGPRNVKGELEMDAAMMCGRSLNFGAVTALQGLVVYALCVSPQPLMT
jgi:isoaspartyl peptidase/L-asparaginase-like protein (Ntn-hydrolase superfamily)